MEEELKKLKFLINSISPISEEDWLTFSSLWKPVTAKRKEILSVAGEVPKYLYFVLDGVQRVYYFDDQNREATIVFTYPPSFGGVLDALLLKAPSRFYYETLTPSKFLQAPMSEINLLMQSNPDIQTMVMQGLTHAFSGVLKRIVELQCFSSEEKFKELLTRSPHILQLVPHKYLANYLGIDATNFSKLINKVKLS